MMVLRRVILPLLGVHFTLALWSGYRAIVQVFSLNVQLSSPTVRPGATVGYDVVSSGRAPVTVTLELVQGPRAETLAVRRVATSIDPAYDPRTKKGSASVVLSAAQLARFAIGPAAVRATALGSSQWLRVPPPTVREVAVTIER